MRRQFSNLVLDQPTTSNSHAAAPQQPIESAPSMAPSSAASDEVDTRFHCPFPGCQRSFAELWRLKVHHRAPTDIRGSGKERGHGTELPMCPRCLQVLIPGRHHTDCIQACSKRKAPREGDPPNASKRAVKAQRSKPPSMAQMPSLLNHSQAPMLAPSLAQGLVTGVCPWLPQLVPFGAHQTAHHPGHQTSHHHPAVGYPVQYQPQMPQLQMDAYGQMMSLQMQQFQMLQQFVMPPTMMGQPGQAPPMQQGQQPRVANMAPPPSMAPPPPAPLPAPPPPPALAPDPAPTSAVSVAPPPPSSNGMMATMFDDLDDEWALMPPSPPPLPDDFGGNNAPSIPFLFNFGQFDQKMHKSQDLKDFDSALAPGSARSCYGGRKGSPSFVPPRSSDSGSQHKDHSPRGSGLNVLPASDPRPPEDVHPSEIDPSAFCFNPQEDGDLLHLVFGMADEMPTMATTHLHMRPGEDVESEGREEEEEVELAFVNRRSIDKSKPEHYLSLPLSSEASFGLGKGSGMDRGEPLPSLPIVSAPAISAPMDVEAPAVNMSWTGALSGAKYLS